MRQSSRCLSKELDVRTPAENADADETTGAFSAEVLSPSRIQASFFYSREAPGAVRGHGRKPTRELEHGPSRWPRQADHRRHKRVADRDQPWTTTTCPAPVTSYALYRSQFAYSRVDGRFASMTSPTSAIVMGSETYAHAASLYRGNNDNQGRLACPCTASPRRRQGVVPTFRRCRATNRTRSYAWGCGRDMVAALWENVALVPDEVTLIKKGQIQITAIMLHAVKILRSGRIPQTADPARLRWCTP